MLAEVCLRGDQILEEVPMFYIDFRNYRDLELTVTRNKFLGAVKEEERRQEAKKKIRVQNKKVGILYGNMRLERSKFKEKTVNENDTAEISTTYLSTRLNMTEFEVLDMDGNVCLIEFRLSIRDILIKSKNIIVEGNNEHGSQHHYEFYFYEINQCDMKEEYCCIYWRTGDKNYKFEFRI